MTLRMSIANLLDPITAAGGDTRFSGLDHWMQGRTLYGGASALIAYTAVTRAFPDLPPLRGAQVAFVAPTGPEAELRREIVRQGRNVAQVRSEIWCEGQCTLTAFWLFGTERDTNGPEEPRIVGTFEQAHGGTLLLDEVADMPLETQGKIVRVLQEQTFYRVGGSTAVSVDVRVMASSSRDLDEAMADGRFRQDLYYRLSVVPIAVPPMTARREDIPELARHFISRSAESSGIPPRDIGDWHRHVLLVVASAALPTCLHIDPHPPFARMVSMEGQCLNLMGAAAAGQGDPVHRSSGAEGRGLTWR